MKKLTAFLASLAMILCLCFSAVACNKQDPSAIAGTYKLLKMTMVTDGTTVIVGPGSNYTGISVTEDSFVLYLREDKTYKMIKTAEKDNDVVTIGTWEYNGNASAAIILTAPDGDIPDDNRTEAIIDDGVFKMTVSETEEMSASESESAAQQTTTITLELKKVSSETDTYGSVFEVCGTYKLSELTVTIGNSTTSVKPGQVGTEITEDTVVLLLKDDKTYVLTNLLEETEDEEAPVSHTGKWDFARNAETVVLFAPEGESTGNAAEDSLLIAFKGDTVTITEEEEETGMSLVIVLKKTETTAGGNTSESESEAQNN